MNNFFKKAVFVLVLLGGITMSFSSCYMHRHQYNSGYGNGGHQHGGGRY